MTESNASSSTTSTSTAPRESATDAHDRLLEEINGIVFAPAAPACLANLLPEILLDRGQEFECSQETAQEIWDTLTYIELNRHNAGPVLGCLRAVRRDVELLPERERLLVEATTEMAKVCIKWMAWLGQYHHPFTTLELSDLFGGDTESQQRRIGVFLHRKGQKAAAKKRQFDQDRRDAERKDGKAAAKAKAAADAKAKAERMAKDPMAALLASSKSTQPRPAQPKAPKARVPRPEQPRRPAASSQPSHEASSILDADGKLRDIG